MKNIKTIIALIIIYLISGNISIAGPVLLVGLDTECCGRVVSSNPATYQLGGHGTINQWAAIYNNMLANATNGGSGILVIGGGKTANDEATVFWNAIGAATGQFIGYSSGAAISTVTFTSYKMIAVITGGGWMSGSLTQTELNAINARATDVAAFVNGGGALFGSTSTPLTNQFGYITAFGPLTITTSNSNGTPTYNLTPQGVTYGFPTSPNTSTINGPWHNTFTVWPSFLNVLATTAVNAGAPMGSVIALGGMTVNIPITPVDDCCKNFMKKVTSTVSPFANSVLNYQVNATIQAGPKNIKKIDVSLVSLSINHSNIDCQRCFNNPQDWGMIVPLSSLSPLVNTALAPPATLNPVNITSYPGTIFGSPPVDYRNFTMGSINGTGISMTSNKTMKFLLSLPKPSVLSCCADTVNFAIRYKFTDTTCVTCDTLVSYKVIIKQTTSGPPTVKSGTEQSLEKLLKDFNPKPGAQGFSSKHERPNDNALKPIDTLLNCISTGRSFIDVVILNRSVIKLTLYDENMKLVKKFDENIFGPDEYTYDLTNLDLPEGKYICRIETENGTEERTFYWKDVPLCPCKRSKQTQKALNNN